MTDVRQGSLLGERLIPISKGGSSDIFQTPPHAFDYISPYIDRGLIVWESATGHGMLADAIKSRGFEVVRSDIMTDQNFFEYQPDKWDVQITNPPYSIKDDWIERSYKLGKPFALLMPVSALHSTKRCNLFREHGISLVIPPKRINFVTPSKQGSGAWFPVMWFCHGLNMPDQIIFAKDSISIEQIGE